eukprot:749303-Hanusia_phi.AAC.1
MFRTRRKRRKRVRVSMIRRRYSGRGRREEGGGRREEGKGRVLIAAQGGMSKLFREHVVWFNSHTQVSPPDLPRLLPAPAPACRSRALPCCRVHARDRGSLGRCWDRPRRGGGTPRRRRGTGNAVSSSRAG